ncbi:MAG: SBBP repeat-containing protein [Thaumarchaeota archaeon]|nr:SBBP repeat-containing protein [Nitrososphaerota archaeon]
MNKNEWKYPLFVLIGIITISLFLGTQNVFALTITQIIDSTGDGAHALDIPVGIATDSSGNVFVEGRSSLNVFKITPSGTITQIIDSTGDGAHALDIPVGIATDSSGNVFVTGGNSNNTFKITPSGTITQIIDSTGDGTHALSDALEVATDSSGNVFVTGGNSDNAFKIAGLSQPPPVSVNIDIKPGNLQNLVDPNSKGIILVAILSTQTFHSITVNPTTVTFGPNNSPAVGGLMKDVNGDGLVDMVLGFKISNTGIFCGETSAVLNGKTLAGIPIQGNDHIQTNC